MDLIIRGVSTRGYTDHTSSPSHSVFSKKKSGKKGKKFKTVIQ